MTSSSSPAEAMQAVFRDFPDLESGRGLDTFDQVQEVRFDGQRLALTLALTTWSAPLWEDVVAGLSARLRSAVPSLAAVEITWQLQHRPAVKLGELGLTVKSLIAVGSGKGGVGKSTIAASLALSLQRAGCRVGLLDADVYGPSITHLLGLTERATMAQDRLQPLSLDGMPVMSIGMFRRIEIPVLGMVENMSGFVCPESGKRYDIFGRGGARERAVRLGVPFLGELPIEIPIREHGDGGRTAANFADPQFASRLEQIASRLVRLLAEGRAASPPLPDLSILS